MSLRRWQRISSEWISENPWWRYRKDVFEIAPGQRGEYHCVHTPGSAMVVPITAAGKLVLVEQYRFLADRFSLEFPCGGIGPHEAPVEAALRELAEEAGCTGELLLLGQHNPWNGVTDEISHVYLAPHVTPTREPVHKDETESFIVHELSHQEFAARIADGTIWDGMTLAAYAIYCASRST